MTETVTTEDIMQSFARLSKQVQKQHLDFAEAIKAERVVKTELLMTLAEELVECGPAIATEGEVVLGWASLKPEEGELELRLGLVLQINRFPVDEGEPSWGGKWWLRRETKYAGPLAHRKIVTDSATTEEQIINSGRFPVEGIFAEAARVMSAQTQGFKAQRTADIRAVTMVLNGVSKAWKRRGGAE